MTKSNFSNFDFSLERILQNARPETIIAFQQLLLTIPVNAPIRPFRYTGQYIGCPFRNTAWVTGDHYFLTSLHLMFRPFAPEVVTGLGISVEAINNITSRIFHLSSVMSYVRTSTYVTMRSFVVNDIEFSQLSVAAAREVSVSVHAIGFYIKYE